MTFSDVTPNLIVTDIDRSTAFYRDVLGFSVVAHVPDAPPFVFVWLQRGGVNVFLNVPEAAAHDLPEVALRPIGGTCGLFILLEAPTTGEGVDALFATVSGRARVLMQPKDQFYGMREFAVEDPDGYFLTFAQRIG
ncbi:MAG TPA: VOC family protein [Vicinamibacterales bacterium]|nr:VOC family protein [Vicinamibacterales bacterium]